MPEGRAGRYVRQPTGYRAFIPASLPPDPPVVMEGDLQVALSRADQALGRLDGVAQTLPNPELFVAMYVRREAVLSSQIEGTQSTLEDVLSYELTGESRSLPGDVAEVVNYVGAMNYGLRRLGDFPLSLRLIREIHGELLSGTRGSERLPGEFRTSQNWIGAQGAPLSEATFVPPPPSEMTAALSNFEKFLHAGENLPALIQCGLAHAQFETIHPFLDGNGRVGRLLITFLLVHRNVLSRPLLYLSIYLKRHRAEYYDRLMAIRQDGNWEGWVAFFLRGVELTATEAAGTARAILALRERHRDLVQAAGSSNGLRLLDHLYAEPLVDVARVRDVLDVSAATAGAVLRRLEDLELVGEVTGRKRNRVFRYSPYLRLFDETDLPADDTDRQSTTHDSA